MEELVSLDQAKAAKRDPNSTYEDETLQLYLDQAHALVLDYVKQRRSDEEDWIATVDGWTDSDAPPQVVGAILKMFVYLQRFRGDDAPQDAPVLNGTLPADVVMMLLRLRDPAVA